MKKKGKGKPRGMNYADLLKARRDRLQLAMDEAALLNVEQSMQRYLWLMAVSCTMLTASVRSACRSFSRRFRRTRTSLRKCGQR